MSLISLRYHTVRYTNSSASGSLLGLRTQHPSSFTCTAVSLKRQPHYPPPTSSQLGLTLSSYDWITESRENKPTRFQSTQSLRATTGSRNTSSQHGIAMSARESSSGLRPRLAFVASLWGEVWPPCWHSQSVMARKEVQSEPLL